MPDADRGRRAGGAKEVRPSNPAHRKAAPSRPRDEAASGALRRARREDAMRERRRRLESSAAARLAKSSNALASRRAEQRLERALAERFAGATRTIAHREQRLAALSPDGVLARGYSITQDAESGAVIRTAAATAAGRRVRVRLGSGRLGARVEEVEP